jgi:hypothetical protein
MGGVAGSRRRGQAAHVIQQRERIIPLESGEQSRDRPGRRVHLGARDALRAIDRPLRQRDALQTSEGEHRELAPHDAAAQQQTELRDGEAVALP